MNTVIGRFSAGASRYWNGSIGKVALYSRGLTAAEVSQNCAATVSRFPGVSCAYNAPTLPVSAATGLAVSSPDGGAPVGGCAAVTVTSVNPSGAATAVTADTFVTLSGGGSGVFYTSSTCTGFAVDGVALAAGTSSAVVYFADATAESLTLGAYAPGLGSASTALPVYAAATPVLATPPNLLFPYDFITQGYNLVLDFYDVANGTPGFDVGLTFTCTFDQVVDNQVSGGASCTTLPSYPAATFDPLSGRFSWTPNSSAVGAFEIKVTGTNAFGTASKIFVVDVEQPYAIANLIGDWDAAFASGSAAYTGSNNAWNDMTPNGFTGTNSDTVHAAWSGSGTVTSPSAITYDGSGDTNFGTGVLQSQSRLMFDTWVNPSASTTGGSIIVGNGGAAGSGVVLRQSRGNPGALELVLGKAAYVDTVLADAPVRYWPLGETTGTTVNDISGHGNNGTYNSGITLGQTGPFASDGSLATSFPGTLGGYASLPNAYAAVSGNDTHTVEFWVSAASLGNSPVVVESDANNGADWQFELGTSNHVYWTTGYNAGPTYRTYTLSGGLAAGTWYHMVFVKTGAGNSGNFYVNGVLQTNYSGSLLSTPSESASINVGHHPGGGYYLSGRVAHLALYNTALTAGQVTAHYNAAIPGVGRRLLFENSLRQQHLELRGRPLRRQQPEPRRQRPHRVHDRHHRRPDPGLGRARHGGGARRHARVVRLDDVDGDVRHERRLLGGQHGDAPVEFPRDRRPIPDDPDAECRR